MFWGHQKINIYLDCVPHNSYGVVLPDYKVVLCLVYMLLFQVHIPKINKSISVRNNSTIIWVFCWNHDLDNFSSWLKILLSLPQWFLSPLWILNISLWIFSFRWTRRLGFHGIRPHIRAGVVIRNTVFCSVSSGAPPTWSPLSPLYSFSMYWLDFVRTLANFL